MSAYECACILASVASFQNIYRQIYPTLLATAINLIHKSFNIPHLISFKTQKWLRMKTEIHDDALLLNHLANVSLVKNYFSRASVAVSSVLSGL